MSLMTLHTDGKTYRIVVGSYNGDGQPGLRSMDFTPSGDVKVLDSLKIDNASYFTFQPGGDILYAVSELSDDDSKVYAIGFDGLTGKMSVLDEENVNGSPCYVDINDKLIVTANYGGGTASVFTHDGRGRIEPMSARIVGDTGGPDTLRQQVPHMHFAGFSHDGDKLYLSDFSADRLLVLDVAEALPNLSGNVAAHKVVALNPGTGTRHIAMSADGRFLYVLGELSGDITVVEKVDDGYYVRQVIESDPVHERASADIRLSPKGDFLYASNRRRNDGIGFFRVDPETGTLAYVGYRNTGSHPRNFAVSPDGDIVLVACRDDNRIEAYRRDAQTGLLTLLPTGIDVERPVCVKFYGD